jgi:exonuclease VII large subunit
LNNANLAGRLSVVHEQLHKWDRYTLQSSKKKIRAAQRELEQVSKHLDLEIERLLEQEEIHWAQRSRVNWLQFGDKNSSYFHKFANTRKERNKIKRLRNDQGVWLEGTTYLNPMISDYFLGLFSTEVHDTDPELLNKVNPRVTTEMNEALQRPFSLEDVKKALFSIGDMKEPASDGLHAIFKKMLAHHW